MKERKAIQDRFKGKVAIISGGSSGIGRATVEEICKEGASVVFTGLEDDGHEMVREMMRGRLWPRSAMCGVSSGASR